MEVGGSGSHSENVCFGKSFQNGAILVVIFWSSTPCVFCLCIHC